MILGYSPADISRIEAPLVRQADAHRGADALMRDAAYALQLHTHRLLNGKISAVTGAKFQVLPVRQRRILVLAGAGNNGGDGLYAAAYLAKRGYPVTVLPLTGRLHERARAAASAAHVRFWPVLENSAQTKQHLTPTSPPFLARATSTGAENRIDVDQALTKIRQWQPVEIIDAITGIGAKPPLREPAAGLVQALRRQILESLAPPLVVACDNPSGLNLETGEASQVLPADLTLTMGAPKAGMLVAKGAELCGRIEVHDFALPTAEMTPLLGQIEAADVAQYWPWPVHHSHKYSRGVLGVCAGSATYPGAGILVSTAARGAGSAFMRYLGPADMHPRVMAAVPEAVLRPGQTQALVIGPGLDPGRDSHREKMLETWWGRRKGEPVVLDAGVLELVKNDIATDASCLLTPHAGEACALAQRLGYRVTRAEIEAEPLHWATTLAAETGATVLLKGDTTVIAPPQGLPLTMTHGTVALATAGSGDVLAGIIGHLLASTTAPRWDGKAVAMAAAVGAWVHAQAGRYAATHLHPTPAATNLVSALAPVLTELRRWPGGAENGKLRLNRE